MSSFQAILIVKLTLDQFLVILITDSILRLGIEINCPSRFLREVIKRFISLSRVGIRAAEIIADKIIKKPNIVLGLPTGSTPIPVYTELINYYSEGLISFKEVKTFNLDEYYPIEPLTCYSYQSSMTRDLFSQIDILAQNIYFCVA